MKINMEELVNEIAGEILAGEYICDRDILKELFDKIDKLRTEVGYMYDHFYDEE